MPRITNAVASRKRRKRRLEQAKGFYGSRSKLFRIATEAVDRAMELSYTHRKAKKRDFRGLWIVRLSAACKLNDVSYSRFIEGLTDGLVPQADAQDRHGRGRAGDQGQADAGLVWCAGAGRQQHGGGVQRPGLVRRQVVVAHHMRRRAQLREVVDEVVGEAVVVIDDEDHGAVLGASVAAAKHRDALKRILTVAGVK